VNPDERNALIDFLVGLGASDENLREYADALPVSDRVSLDVAWQSMVGAVA
jgi:hypothetical protein